MRVRGAHRPVEVGGRELLEQPERVRARDVDAVRAGQVDQGHRPPHDECLGARHRRRVPRRPRAARADLAHLGQVGVVGEPRGHRPAVPLGDDRPELPVATVERPGARRPHRAQPVGVADGVDLVERGARPAAHGGGPEQGGVEPVVVGGGDVDGLGVPGSPPRAGSEGTPSTIQLATACATPAEWVIHTASASQSPGTSVSPSSGIPSGVKENRPLTPRSTFASSRAGRGPGRRPSSARSRAR